MTSLRLLVPLLLTLFGCAPAELAVAEALGEGERLRQERREIWTAHLEGMQALGASELQAGASHLAGTVAELGRVRAELESLTIPQTVNSYRNSLVQRIDADLALLGVLQKHIVLIPPVDAQASDWPLLLFLDDTVGRQEQDNPDYALYDSNRRRLSQATSKLRSILVHDHGLEGS